MPASENPKLEIPISTTGKILEAIGLLLIAALWYYALSHYSQLPDIIPTHFTGSGEVDGYGGKWTIILMPVIGTLLYICMAWVSRYPHKFNYMVTITEENAFKQYSIVTSMFRVLRIAIAILFFFICYTTVQAGLGQTDIFGKWHMLIVFGLLFVPVFYFLIQSSKNS